MDHNTKQRDVVVDVVLPDVESTPMMSQPAFRRPLSPVQYIRVTAVVKLSCGRARADVGSVWLSLPRGAPT